MYNPASRDKRDWRWPTLGVVEFAIRLSELRKAQKQLLFNRGAFKETDCADLLVSPCVATFKTVGTEFEAPAVFSAEEALRVLGVARERIQEFVDARIKVAAQTLIGGTGSPH
jgi:hypothetical protein